ncbi:hypothetical protein MATL_G00231350 [Megalops atlanticus]|uniref:C2H2-type domain-containing protein n=1 Tax=Megalops atlanticus TaxID=7932 RepID=A0A9D3PHC9_MEGAT|nr:hypothetical protein MATL_G00231350 [Megalops atlanticus]
MRPKRLSCQDCDLNFDSMSAYKKHSRKNGHQQQVAELFQTAPYYGPVHFPNFVVLEYLSKLNRGYPVIGLQLVSFCISTEAQGPTFYLCHVCQEKCPGGTVLSHLMSTEHYFSVFAYTNPELLQFGWLPPPESVPGLKKKAEVLEKQQGTGVLKVIDIPKKVFENMKMSPYSQTMKELTQSEKQREACLGDQPERMTLQEYLKNPERTNPLLGLQFLVEYRPSDSSKLCGYLCLLCKKRVKDTQVIAHVIGFDHLFWYLDLVHPSSLASKSSYQQYSERHRSQLLDLAKQAQELGSSGEVQEVKLDPAVFAAVDCGSYAKALELLQTVRKEQNQSDLWPLVTPGQRLFFGTLQRMKPPGVPPVIVQKTFPESQTVPVKEMVQSPSAPQEHAPVPQHTDTESDQTAVTAGHVTSSGISCQDCGPGAHYVFISEYKKHVRGGKHKQRVESLFQTVLHRTTVPVPSLVVYENLGKPHRTAPVIGLQLVTACIDTATADPPVYLCHVCHECSSHFIMAHLTSPDHYFNALAFMSPQRLPFGWMPSQDMLSLLTPRVKAEEKQHGPGMLQVLDMPKELFQMIGQTPYFTSMRIICQTEELKERLRVRKLVTLQEYLSNPKRTHPMLGLQFLVEYRPSDSSKLCGYLCLLCKKRVKDTQVIAHVIGFDHLFWYLDLAHPSSLACKSHYKQYDAEYRTMILDLAKQAEQIDSSGKVKVMTLDPAIYEEVESSDFTMALNKLQTIWREQNQSDLQPLVTPGERLVPKKQKSTQSSEWQKPPQSSELQKLPQSSELQKPAQSSELQKPTQPSDPHKPAQSSELQNLAQSSEPQEPVLSLEGQNLPQSSDLQRPGKSSELLWSYLKNKERTEPVIGLDAVIECVSGDLPPYYLCVACAEKMPQACIVDHLISPSHRYLYLKSHHLLSGWEETADLTKMIAPLKERAATLEQEKGYGEAQVLELEATQYAKVIASSIDVALNSLRTIQEKQNQSDLRLPVSPGEGEGLVKEEALQNQVTLSNQNSESTVTVREEILQSPGVEGPALGLKCTKKSWILGEQSQTQASKVLWRYLNNKQRREPIIGLSDIMECQSDNQPSILECKACAKTFRADFIIGHVIGSRHRYSYIRSKHPDLLEGWRENHDLTGNIQALQAMAKVLERKEGWGQFEVMKVKQDTVKEVGLTSTDKEKPIQKPRTFQEPDAQGRSNFALTHLVKKKKKKKGKKQPIIGLREVTECCAVNQQMFYICDICFVKISKNHILQHVSGDLHRYNYIKSQYPSLMKRDVKRPDLTESLSDYFLNLARVVVQKEKGVGDVQIMELDVELYKELLSMPDDSALSKLQKIREERNQKKDVTQQRDVKDLKHRPPSTAPQPAPKQPCLSLPPNGSATEETGKGGETTEAQGSVDSLKETVTIKQELVESGVTLQEPDSTEAKTVTVKQEKVESQMSCEESQESQSAEEPVQDPTDMDTEPVTEVEETVPTLLAPSEQNQDQKRTDTEEVTATEDIDQSPGPPEKHVPASRGAETKASENGVAACEEVVRWQMSPHISLQCLRNTATKRAAVPVGESHLAKFMLPFLTNKPEPLVGLRAVVECRSFKQPTFYLCLTCAEKINKNHMCNHIISARHQHRYIESQYPKLLPHWEKNPADVAWWVEDRERIWDAQVMKLDLKSYEQVASAPFDTALDKLQAIRREQNQSDLRPLMSPGERPVVVHKWRILHQEAPQKPLQELDRTQSQRVDSSEENIQHRVTPPESVSVNGKRVQSPAPAQKPSLNMKDTETQRVTVEEETAKRGGVCQVPVRESQGTGLTEDRTFRTPLDLRGYVEDPRRSLPVVGLSALIECRSESHPPLYLCLACSTQLSKTLVISHVISRKHHLSYLRAKRPDLYSGWSDSQDSAKMANDLMEMGREAERQEPAMVREIQEVSLDSAAYAEVKSMPFDKALALLHTIQKEQNRNDLRLCLTPEPRRVTVKQETMESQVFPKEPAQDPKGTETQLGTVKLERDQWQAAQEPVQHPKSPEREGGVHEEKQPPVEIGSHQECHSGSAAKTPLIGLKMVIECRNVEGRPPARFCLCRACSVKLAGDQQSVSKHVRSPLHQYCYIKSHHSRRLEIEKKAGRLTCGLTDLVQFVAKKLEEEEGSGSVQVINMPEGIYNRLSKRNYEYCMKMLKGCGGVEERQTGSTQGNRSITLHTATKGPGQTLQRSDSGSDNSGDSPVSQGPPVKSSRRPLVNVRNHEEARQRPQSPGGVATHNPLPLRGRHSPDPLPSHRPDHLSCKTGEPRSRSPRQPSLTRSAPGANDPPPDALPDHPAGITEPAGTRQPSPTVGPSHGTDARRSAATKGGPQGAQISTVPLLYSRSANQQLTAGGAAKQKLRRERSGDDDPWNYENRQFSPDFGEPGPQEKRGRVACDGRGSAQTAHVPQVGAQTQRASGGRCCGNMVIDSRTALEQESLASRGGQERGVREPGKAVCGAGGHSRTECLTKNRPSEDSTRKPTPPLSSSKSGRVPEKGSLLGKRLRQSPEAQHQADSKPSDSDSPPVKIRGLDGGDSVENPAVKLLTCWKQITGGERRA